MVALYGGSCHLRQYHLPVQYLPITCEFPSKWKQANVTPVPKSGDMRLVNNFRPVSVIPVLAKVFETVVHHQLYEYLESHPLQGALHFNS